MTVYELMIKTNHYIIGGGDLTAPQKANIVRQLLAGRSTPEQVRRFHFAFRSQSGGPQMYPSFYIPPYNDGKKYETVIPMAPKTHILSANSYELEIIRLLHLFASHNAAVQNMVEQTLFRLKATCFGYKSCYTGECFHTALIVLRFVIAVAPRETGWIKKQISLYHTHAADTRRHAGVKQYFELCLSELEE